MELGVVEDLGSFLAALLFPEADAPALEQIPVKGHRGSADKWTVSCRVSSSLMASIVSYSVKYFARLYNFSLLSVSVDFWTGIDFKAPPPP